VETGRLIAGSTFDEERFRQLAKANYARSFRPQGGARQLTAIMASPDRTPGLRTVTAPTLVVHGLMDELVRPSGGLATARAVAGSRLVMYPEMGHDLPVGRWEELADEVRRNADRAA
jgi:pimeloyl-ACP methyl ester carboxylesterase